MDPVTIAATILTIIQLIDRANRLLTGLTSAPREFARFLTQVQSLTSILSSIRTDLSLDRDSIINRCKTLKARNQLDLDDLIKLCEKGVKRVQVLLDDYRGVTRRGLWSSEKLLWSKQGKQEVRESLYDLQGLTTLIDLFVTKEVAQGVSRLEREIAAQKSAYQSRERQRNKETHALFTHFEIPIPPDAGRNIANLFTASVIASRWLGRLRTRKFPPPPPPPTTGRVGKSTSKTNLGYTTTTRFPLPHLPRRSSLRSSTYQTRIVAPQTTTPTPTPPPPNMQLKGWRVASDSYIIGPKIHKREPLKRSPSQLQELVNLAQTRGKALDRRHHAVTWLMGSLGSRWTFLGGREEGGERFVVVVGREG
ncbi:hypothetical protein EG327_001000 [Venturia inaequalis]|uniref:Fungal N-terminal domain-containing protein n=1 Tax=Venturia inaequalis TaxID=5025 RepID=A0A8H3VIG2_VENIN|nr:hypothetical protein EG327_001000 [Venturia inaequalis]